MSPKQNLFDKFNDVFIACARICLGLVMAWFGIHELLQPTLWTGYVPFVSSGSGLALGAVLVHGWILTTLGIALVFGVLPRLAGAVSAVVMLEIVLGLATHGLSDIVARDVGVLGLALAVAANPHRRWTIRG